MSQDEKVKTNRSLSRFIQIYYLAGAASAKYVVSIKTGQTRKKCWKSIVICVDEHAKQRRCRNEKKAHVIWNTNTMFSISMLAIRTIFPIIIHTMVDRDLHAYKRALVYTLVLCIILVRHVYLWYLFVAACHGACSIYLVRSRKTESTSNAMQGAQKRDTCIVGLMLWIVFDCIV